MPSCKWPTLIFRKLIKFRGKDFGRSKLEKEFNVNQVEFPEGTSLKQIFLPAEDSEERRTLFGEVVYMRHALDFSSKGNS